MLRGMIFVDHLNFNIALHNYYRSLGLQTPKLDYNSLFKNIVNMVNMDFMKACVFVPRPDNFLMQDRYLFNYYNWVTGLSYAPYTEVIEGDYVARPVDEAVPMDINQRNTYYKVEKGTDVNLAVHVLQKAFYNSYDVAFVLSADTDYLKVYEVLKSMGKLVIVVGVKGQSMARIRGQVDNILVLEKSFFDTCLRHADAKDTSVMV